MSLLRATAKTTRRDRIHGVLQAFPVNCSITKFFEAFLISGQDRDPPHVVYAKVKLALPCVPKRYPNAPGRSSTRLLSYHLLSRSCANAVTRPCAYAPTEKATKNRLCRRTSRIASCGREENQDHRGALFKGPKSSSHSHGRSCFLFGVPQTTRPIPHGPPMQYVESLLV